MSDLDRSIGRVRLVLFIFAVLFVASLGALGFRSAVTQVIPVGPQVLEGVAAASAIGVLATVLIGWIGVRRVLRRQERELQRQAAELTLTRQELEWNGREHELELKLKEQELEKEVMVRKERFRVCELEHALKLQQLELERLEGGQPSVRSVPSVAPPHNPPVTLNRQRRVLAEPDPFAEPAAPDAEIDRS